MIIVQIGLYPLNANKIKGGVEASVYGISSELAKKNEVHVLDSPRFVIRKDCQEVTNKLTVHRFRSGWRNNMAAILRIMAQLSLIKKINPQICHIHSVSLYTFSLYLLLKVSGFPTIVTVHGLAHIEKKNIWKKNRTLVNFLKYISHSFVEFVFLSLCPIFIVDTHYVFNAIKKYKEERKIIRTPTCFVIPQGIAPIFFLTENPPSDTELLSVGAIDRRKGHLFLIDAFAKVHKVFPDVSLTIAGTLSNNAYYRKLIDRIDELGLKEYINVIPDAELTEILDLYANSAIFVLHSEEESQGIVFCEAMAASKPIAATNVGGIPFIVENQTHGLLSDFGDTETFSDNIIQLIRNKEYRLRMSNENHKNAQKYKWESVSDEIILVYQSIILS